MRTEPRVLPCGAGARAEELALAARKTALGGLRRLLDATRGGTAHAKTGRDSKPARVICPFASLPDRSVAAALPHPPPPSPRRATRSTLREPCACSRRRPNCGARGLGGGSVASRQRSFRSAEVTCSRWRTLRGRRRCGSTLRCSASATSSCCSRGVSRSRTATASITVRPQGRAGWAEMASEGVFARATASARRRRTAGVPRRRRHRAGGRGGGGEGGKRVGWTERRSLSRLEGGHDCAGSSPSSQPLRSASARYRAAALARRTRSAARLGAAP